MPFLKIRFKQRRLPLRKSLYALTFGYISSKKKLNKVVSVRYVIDS